MHDGKYSFEVVSGVPVVAAPEEIDITTAPELRSALLEAAAHGHGTLVADMTRTQFCDSSGLHTLLAAHKRAQAEGGELLLAMSAAPVSAFSRSPALTASSAISRPWMRPSGKRPPTGRTAIGELTAHLRAANRTGSSRYQQA